MAGFPRRRNSFAAKGRSVAARPLRPFCIHEPSTQSSPSWTCNPHLDRFRQALRRAGSGAVAPRSLRQPAAGAGTDARALAAASSCSPTATNWRKLAARPGRIRGDGEEHVRARDGRDGAGGTDHASPRVREGGEEGPLRHRAAGRERLAQHHRGNPRRRGRRGGRAVRRRPRAHVHALRGAGRLEDRDARPQPGGKGRHQGNHFPRSAARTFTRSCATRAACIASSACPRPRRRAASTPRPRRSPCCRRRRKSMWSSARTTSRSASAARAVRAGRGSTRPTPPCRSRTSRAG